MLSILLSFAKLLGQKLHFHKIDASDELFYDTLSSVGM